MKIQTIIYATVLLLLAGCHGSQRYETQLLRADQLLELTDSVDAAVQLLDSIGNDARSLSRKQQMRYRLLQMKARNKQDRLTEGDTTFSQVADYYRRHGSANERVEAIYLLARAYHNMGRLPQAIDLYQQADQAADTTRSDCNWKHLFLVHSQLSQIYSDQRLPDANLHELNFMRQYATKAKDTLNLTFCESWKANTLWDRGMYDQAVDAENKANQQLISKGYTTLANGNHTLAIYRLLEQKRPNEARRLMDLQENHSGIFDKNGDIDRGREIYYYSMGWYQLQANHLDSAKHLFYKLLSFPSDNNCMEAGYRGLFMLYQKTRQVDSIIKYAQLYCNTNDSALKSLSTEKVEFIRSQYEYTKYQRIAEEKHQEAKATLYTACIIVLLLVVVIFLILHTYYIYKKKQRRKNELANERYAEAYRRYVNLRNEYAKRESEMAGSKEDNLKLASEKKDMEKEIKRLISIIKNQQQDEQRPERWNLEAQILTCAEVVSMHQYAVKGSAPDSLWNDLITKCNLYLPQFMTYINQKKAGLTENEKRIVILTKLRFIGTELQNLLDKSSQSITNSRANINKKLYNRKGAQGIDDAIHEIGEVITP